MVKSSIYVNKKNRSEKIRINSMLVLEDITETDDENEKETKDNKDIRDTKETDKAEKISDVTTILFDGIKIKVKNVRSR